MQRNQEDINHQLIKAAYENNEALLDEAIAMGADVNCFGSISRVNGNPMQKSATALMYAASYKYHGIVKKLLSLNADTELTDDLGWTALMYSAYMQDLDGTKLLINHCANVHTKTNSGCTILMQALRGGGSFNKNLKNLLTLMIDKHCDINSRDHKGNTAIMYALDMKDSKLLEFIINKGADVTCVNKQQESLLTYSYHVGIAALSLQLIDAGVPIDRAVGTEKNNEIHYALLHLNASELKTILEKIIASPTPSLTRALQQRNNEGLTPLESAHNLSGMIGKEALVMLETAMVAIEKDAIRHISSLPKVVKKKPKI